MDKKTPRRYRGVFVFCGRRKELVESDQIFRCHLTVALFLKFELNLLTLVESLHAGTLYSGDVNECVGAAFVRSDEAKAFGGVEPLNGTSRHGKSFLR